MASFLSDTEQSDSLTDGDSLADGDSLTESDSLTDIERALDDDESHLFTPRKLYFLWEAHFWAAGALNFDTDRRDWSAMSREQRDMLLDGLASMYSAESRIAAVFGPILLSAESDQEAAFLATQQVDEARHMQFFDRFWREVVESDNGSEGGARDDGNVPSSLAFTELFDNRLMRALERLRMDPTDVEAKVEAVTMYHLVTEATLGLTGQYFLVDFLERGSILPGLAEGLRNLKRDEHRHVAYGTGFLRQKCREDDRFAKILQVTLGETLPLAASGLVKGGSATCDGLDDSEFLDYPSARLTHVAFAGLARRLKAIGGATEEAQRFAASGAWRAARLA